MVQTRRQGARPEGVSYSDTPKRERKPRPAPRRRANPTYRDASVSVPVVAPRYKDASTQTDIYVDAVTQMDVELTSYPEPASAKRRRDEDETTPVTSSKRQRKAETPKFLFSTTRNRSLLTSAPAKTTTLHESPFFERSLEPIVRQSTPTRPSRPSERVIEPETPTPAPTSQGGIFGSVKKIFGFFRGTMEPSPPAEQDKGSRSEQADNKTEQEAVEFHIPTTPPSQRDEARSPTPDPEALDSHIYNRDYFKRRRFAKTIAGREQMEAGRNDSDSGEPDFNPVETLGTNKRKLTSFDGEIPGPVTGGYGIDDRYLEVDTDVDGIEEPQSPEAQPSTPINKVVSQTPLRSAMRQNGGLFGTLGRSAKSVRINPNTSVKHVYGQYGYSGEYHGSMFSDPSDATESTISEVRNMHSPITLRNTKDNESPKFRLNQDIVDPNDEFWRPSLANPAPGHFRVPDLDEDDDEGDDETTMREQEREQDQVPPQPSTPRMSHAELPSQISSFTGHTDSILMNDSAEIRLNKARSDAQKYKPARSSRLSLSEHARSRSSSPPESEGDFTNSKFGLSAPSSGRLQSDNQSGTPTQKTPTQSAGALGREELDNTVVGEDGMTDYQRAHQYDAWAENLAWPEPQTYEEAGIASDYIADLVRKNWTERDTRESIEYWDREFEEGLKAAREAAAQGREVVWVTDP
ncbi:hypothetical protein A1O3_09220 [Capronia epimyces CBS 606.96]|uniref:Uncharacterized protein n=1 Tax=Capronia epimyces CBS 606.96 TaxID=1182542 RepID=W9Y6K9_9EURO|nr:uncharacterized protein A1O3_09220 [Capronia epimyces CBS 606.96]EXJ78059.1 hypothetical protein A1O3_09220 [Capronia epimyces CBS 606.96]